MTLPPSFHTSEEYFTKCASFLRRYQCLYNFPNTDILVENILDKLKIDTEAMDVFDPDFDLSKAEGNEILKDFFRDIETFKTPNEDITVVEDKTCEVALSPKKRHEIIHLATEVVQACGRSNCDTVVDFGSGLGYLDQQIYQTTNLNILGIECNETNYNSAKNRQNKYHPSSTDRVKFIKHFITEDSHTNIEEYLSVSFRNHSGFCITGLHSCADLTVVAINLFLKMESARAMVLMPCCYHKMKMDTDNDGSQQRFANFPLSTTLANVHKVDNGVEYMRVPLLRLASQPLQTRAQLTHARLRDNTFSLLCRAVLQLYAHTNGCKLKRTKRKPVNMKANPNDFNCYIEDAVANGFKLIPQTLSDKQVAMFNLEHLHLIWQETNNDQTFKKAAILILLQNYLQPIVENFVLYDRLVFLKENGVNHCSFKKIFNETISPRCLCLLAYKYKP